jgi:hypothetical protein
MTHAARPLSMLPRATLAALALASLGACAQVADAGRAALAMVPGQAAPRTVALSTPPEPAGKPAAPLAGGFTARDLITGGTLAFDVLRQGDRVAVRQSDGCAWTRADDWFAPSSAWENCDGGQWATGRAEVRRTASIWPLREGAEGGFTRTATAASGRSYQRDTSCRVAGAEAVVREDGARTPAWVVRCRDGKRTRTTWWAPGEGPVAFRKTHDQNGVEEAWMRL